MKNTIIGLNISALIFILLSFNIVDIALRFLITGEIPYVKTTISPDGMLVIIALCIMASVAVFVPRHIARKAINDIKSHNTRLPKRRYTRV